MRMERNLGLGQMPLPGDRQGMSGAGAGHDSIRDVGGRELRRRAPVRQQATAPQEENRRGVDDDTEIQRAEDRLAPLPQGSPTVRRRAARRREEGGRLRWTTEMNVEVMRSFYIINRCRDEPLPGWRHSLHGEFSRRNPTLNLTEQNIVDRKNAIIKKRYLTELQLQNIKREVGQLIHQQEEYQNPEDPEERQEDIPTSPGPDAAQPDLPRAQEEDHQAKFLDLIALYGDMDPSSRPRIPKLRNIQKAQGNINNVNNILRRYLGDTNDLSKVHLGLYCAAVLTVELNGQQVYQPNPNPRKNVDKAPMWRRRLEKNIDELRAQADVLNEYLAGNTSRKVFYKTREIARKAQITINTAGHRQELLNHKDLLRQKAKAKGAQLRRYNEVTKRKKQNSDFESNFYGIWRVPRIARMPT